MQSFPFKTTAEMQAEKIESDKKNALREQRKLFTIVSIFLFILGVISGIIILGGIIL